MDELQCSRNAAKCFQKAADSAASGNFAEARRQCLDILRSDPRNAGALHILGAVCSCEGDLRTAEDFLRRAVALEPDHSEWLRDLGVVRLLTADYSGALDALSQSLALDPADISVVILQARALWESGRAAEALPAFDRWSEAEPAAAKAWLGAARCLLKLNRLPEALKRARRALRADPDSLAGNQLLAQIYYRLHQHDRVLAHRLEIMRRMPGDSLAQAMTAVAYYHLGDTDAAVSLFRFANPATLSAELHAAFLAVLLHHSSSTPELLIEEHQRWAGCHGAVPPAGPAFSHQPLAGRRLHIAYLCTELASSPLFRFFPPLLQKHDRDRFDISLYSTDSSLSGRAEHAGVAEAELKDISGWTERNIAEQMRRDGVDILVGFCGHFGWRCLLVAAMRAAPIQVSYPSYPATTGIPEMDYIFTDRWTCQSGQETQYTERPYRLDSGYLVYRPPDSVRFVGALPANRNGSITFGVFQRPAKLNSHVWDAIAEILKQVENSLLLIHFGSADLNSKTSASRLRLMAALESRGIDPARASFRGQAPFNAHMRQISTVDIALDSFPYTGQTTTCECLWMGVPVVTLAGNTHVSRVGAGLLMRAGLGDFVASDVAEYIRIAVRTASDLPALAALRKGLRRRVKASTLVDGARLAREVEAAYMWMWQQRIGTDARKAVTPFK
jgi:predicted O-linked N-acetylglucosamine transferase (SPINDLY family)